MYIAQVRKKDNSVIEPVEIPQDVVPWIKLIALSEEPRINLMEHRRDLLDYLSGSKIPGASLVVMMLKRYHKVELIRY